MTPLYVCPLQKEKEENSRVVTIRQCAESVSIWEGTDHLLICHHPGSGIVHLGSIKKMVCHNLQHKTKAHKPEDENGILSVHLCSIQVKCVCYSSYILNVFTLS